MNKFKYMLLVTACSSMVNVWADTTTIAWIQDTQDYGPSKYKCCQQIENQKHWWVSGSGKCANGYKESKCDKNTHMFNEQNQTFETFAGFNEHGIGIANSSEPATLLAECHTEHRGLRLLRCCYDKQYTKSIWIKSYLDNGKAVGCTADTGGSSDACVRDIGDPVNGPNFGNFACDFDVNFYPG